MQLALLHGPLRQPPRGLHHKSNSVLRMPNTMHGSPIGQCSRRLSEAWLSSLSTRSVILWLAGS
jgi:hypothetical protein